MKSRVLSIGVLAAAFATGACGKDPFAVKANFDVEADTLVLYALNGTPAESPTAVNTPFHLAVRADSTFAFDIAFDLDATGQVLVLPVSRVGSAVAASRRVGIAKPDTSFEDLTRAPGSGYVFDSTTVVQLHRPFVVMAASAYCSLSTSQSVFSKFVIDSVTADRRLWLRTVVDPNCGFRSFKPGVPKS